jgi:hypothetical protein
MSKGEHGEHGRQAFLGDQAVDCFSLGAIPVWVIVPAFRPGLATLGQWRTQSSAVHDAWSNSLYSGLQKPCHQSTIEVPFRLLWREPKLLLSVRSTLSSLDPTRRESATNSSLKYKIVSINIKMALDIRPAVSVSEAAAPRFLFTSSLGSSDYPQKAAIAGAPSSCFFVYRSPTYSTVGLRS